MAAEAGVDGHHQHEINLVHHIFNRRFMGGGADRHARTFAERFDLRDGAVEMRRGFGVDGDNIGTCLRKFGDEVEV